MPTSFSTRDLPPFNCAVFALGDTMGLVHLDAETTQRDTAEAIASGFVFAGSIGVNKGETIVSGEPGFEIAMVRGGFIFAGLLGERLKAHGLAQLEPVPDATPPH